MTKVVIDMSIPLDGFVAGPDDTGIDHIFEWYFSGDEEFRDPLFRAESGVNRNEVERMFVKTSARRQEGKGRIRRFAALPDRVWLQETLRAVEANR